MSPQVLTYLPVIVVLAVTMASGWVAVDAARRGRAWFAWAMLVAVTGGLTLPFWIVVRRRSPPVAQVGAQRALILFASPMLSILVLGTLSAAVGATFVFRVARVEGQAMSPTLRDQDRLIVNRFAYRLAPPQRGDVVMHRYPKNPDRAFVKRIIAQEGDRVEIIAGRVYLNGALLDDAYIPVEARSADRWGPEVVPPDSYFVLGDRRNNSSDSRHWGFVPRHYVLGRIQARWWPLADARTF